MITILITILIILIATIFGRLKERRVGSKDLKRVVFFVISISTIYFLLLFIATNIGGESTPVWVTATNHLDKKIKVYIITVYDHPVYDDISRFVYKGGTLNIGDSSTTIIEYDGAKEFWTVVLDDLDKVVFFETTKVDSIEKYNFNIDKGLIADQSKLLLAKADIIVYNKDRLIKDILIWLDIMLTIVLLIEILTSKPAVRDVPEDITKKI